METCSIWTLDGLNLQFMWWGLIVLGYDVHNYGIDPFFLTMLNCFSLIKKTYDDLINR